MSVEGQRQLLEELNVLEKAISQRFRRNPYLHVAANIRESDEILESKPKRPHRESLSQQHELGYFRTQYALDTERCTGGFGTNSLKEDISAMKDAELKFDCILSRIQGIDEKYHGAPSGNASSLLTAFSMYSSAPEDAIKEKGTRKIKRKYHLSRATEHIDAYLTSAFSETELYGKYLDLTLFYEMYKTMSGSPHTYADYLESFLKFEDSQKLQRSPDYTRYLDGLCAYLQNFHSNAFPLGLSNVNENDNLPSEDATKEEEKDSPARKSGVPNEKGEVFCQACDKVFAKESVYKGHLSGKKHKKNEEALKTGSDNSQEHKEQDKPPQSDVSGLESKIKKLASQLQPILEQTKTDHSRRARFTDREQELEKLALEGELSDFTAVDSCSNSENSENDDGDDFDAYSKDLPLGTDGIPIPLWLYKLQGLHRTYSCEVCGNTQYKGRQQFNKHFSSRKHVYGLQCLGVSEHDTSLFSNISSIAEVQDLWKKVEAQKTSEGVEDDDAVEVEDEEGNVMSRKDYDELKKQGLI